MPERLQAETHDAERVEKLLHARGAKHLRARKRGATVIVESGPTSDPVKHFRIQRDTVHLWRLDVADHNGRWEHTPFRAQLADLVATVIDQFGWILTPIDDTPERTSDRRY